MASDVRERVPIENDQWEVRFGGCVTDNGFTIASKMDKSIVCERWPAEIVGNEEREAMYAKMRLIVAAPKLLAALEDLIDAVELADPGVYDLDEAHNAISLARSAPLPQGAQP